MVFALIIANAGYFLWARGIAMPPPLPGAPASPNDLRLVSEGPAGGAPGAAAAGPPAAPTPVAAVPPAAAPALASAAAAAAPTAAASAPAAAAAAAAGSAAHPAATGNSAPEVAGMAGGVAGGAEVQHCVSVGPFPDLSHAVHAAATLRRAGFEPRSRAAEGEVANGVWLYLPVPADSAAKQQLISTLKQGGIDDALEMPGPGAAPILSLGTYNTLKRGEPRLSQVQALGLKPIIADRRRNGTVYWIDVSRKGAEAAVDLANLQVDANRLAPLATKPCTPAGTAP
jgi:hypothetical protein